MYDRHLLSFFRRALTLTLALPACGGATTPTVGGGGDAGGAESGLPQTHCDWSEASQSTCNWSLDFTGDPVMCAGFSGVGTAAQCAAVCGKNSEGIAADTCQVLTGDLSQQAVLNCSVHTGPTCGSTPCCNGGRRTAYFASLGFGLPPVGRELGMHFARVACMEASSVEAFRILRDELVAHGAPRRLVRAASRAMRDEMRHVRQTSALARRFGEEPIAPVASPPRALRSLASMALDNAVEGTIRETYSALECAWQAEVAVDPVVRATMKRIARDELRHLALSWAVHAWVVTRLDGATRAHIEAARRAELAELRRELAADPHESLVVTGGLPRAFQSRALLSAIETRAAA
jgi:hypothetical protein